MRISDWSSDVCSSDLEITLLHPPRLLWITTKQPLNELAHFDVDQAEKVRLRRIERVIQIEYPVADMGKARKHGRRLMIRGAVGKAISQFATTPLPLWLDSLRSLSLLPSLMGEDYARSEERREGKSVSVSVDLGGRRIIKKKTI